MKVRWNIKDFKRWLLSGLRTTCSRPAMKLRASIILKSFDYITEVKSNLWEAT